MGVSNARHATLEQSPVPLRTGPDFSMLTAPTLRLLKRLATQLPLNRQAAIVARLLPRGLWYRAALAIARAQGRLVERMGGNRALTTELMLDYWLRELSFSGPYPIPYRSHGMEICLTPGPKLFSWTHLPLTEVPMRLYFEGGGAPVVVVCDAGNIVGDNEFQVFGWAERMEAVLADSHLVSRVVRTLRSGKSVVYLVDAFLGGPISDVPVRLAGRLRVPLIFQWTELADDGTLDVTYREAPCPYSRTEEEIAENIAFLRESRARTLTRLGWGVPPAN